MPALCGSTIAPSPEPRAHRRDSPCSAFVPRLPAGSPRLHPGGGRHAPQHMRAESLSACFKPRVTPRCAAVLSAERASCLGHLCSGLRAVKVSCREGFHTRATAVRTPAPKATTSPHCSSLALACDTVASRCRAPLVVPCFSAGRPSSMPFLSLAGTRARGVGRAQRTPVHSLSAACLRRAH
jgi:hypothetical protein